MPWQCSAFSGTRRPTHPPTYPSDSPPPPAGPSFDELQVSEALEFGGTEFVVKYILYILHERMWALITFI